MSLLVVGSVAFDAIETPFGKTDKIIGGAATYISLSASFFTNPVNLVSIVGYDFPQETLDDFKKRGVDLEGLEQSKDQKSFFWSGKYHNDMNTRDTLDTQLNVLENFDPKVPAAYAQDDYVMLGNMVPDVQRKVVEQMKNRPKLIAMDTMNLWIDVANDSLRQTIALVDMLILNDEEARQLTNQYSLVKAAKDIMNMGPKYVVIKKGEHGALMFYQDHVFVAPALPLEDVFDPTGAGDTFAGGMLGYIAAVKDTSFNTLKNAVIYGSAMASFCVEKFGPERLLELDKDEMRSRYKQFQSLVNFDVELI